MSTFVSWIKGSNKMSYNNIETVTSEFIIQSGSIDIASTDDPTTIPYMQCGIVDPKSMEILLLHGTAFTKEHWKTSGIMEKLCLQDSHAAKTRTMSVIALDLPVTADGTRLYEAFLALKDEKLIMGNPLVIVTPSASGKAVLSLSSFYHHFRNSTNVEDSIQASMLPNMLKAWIPIASYAVARETQSLASFKSCRIPILALYGKEDDAGKRVSKKLVDYGAEMMELDGGHACYLDSPDEFVFHLLEFVDKL
jgi:pimeloyl-ACP methyl ester carboxylesterase